MKKIFTITAILIVISVSIYYLLCFILVNRKSEYEELGYNPDQILIIKTLDNPKVVLKYEYSEFIIGLIQTNDFDENNLENYIELNSKFNLNIEDTIYIVNNNYYNETTSYTEETVSLMKEIYYINDNLDRYLAYKQNSEIDNYNIILNVNCNLDYDFYTNTKSTDLSKGYLILVNKFNNLDKNYVPENLVALESKYGVSGYLESKTYESFKAMWAEAYNSGLSLYINSPYRSYSTQYTLYNNYGARDGYTLADTYSARAGFSEHQTGLAFDVTSKSTNFDTFQYSSEYEWLQENAYKYGFILRYPKDKEYITGYQYESWHYRYVGIEVAKIIHEKNLTFEEYYAYYVK